MYALSRLGETFHVVTRKPLSNSKVETLNASYLQSVRLDIVATEELVYKLAVLQSASK